MSNSNLSTPKPFIPWAQQPSVENARISLDIWASVTKALANGCGIPTIEAILGIDPPMLPSFKSPVTGLTVDDWCERHATDSGRMHRRTVSKDGKLSPQFLVMLSVDVALATMEMDPRAFLLRRYPRTGVYETSSQPDRHNDRFERPIIDILRARLK